MKAPKWLLGLVTGIIGLIVLLFNRRSIPTKTIVDAEKKDAAARSKSEEIAQDVERYAREAEAAEKAPVVLPGTQAERDAELRRLGEIK